MRVPRLRDIGEVWRIRGELHDFSAELEFSPEQITDVVLSHHHPDHTAIVVLPDRPSLLLSQI